MPLPKSAAAATRMSGGRLLARDDRHAAAGTRPPPGRATPSTPWARTDLHRPAEARRPYSSSNVSGGRVGPGHEALGRAPAGTGGRGRGCASAVARTTSVSSANSDALDELHLLPGPHHVASRPRSGTSGTGRSSSIVSRATCVAGRARTARPRRASSAAGAPPCCAFGSHGPRASSVGTNRSPSGVEHGVGELEARRHGRDATSPAPGAIDGPHVGARRTRPPVLDLRLLDGKVALITGAASGPGPRRVGALRRARRPRSSSSTSTTTARPRPCAGRGGRQRRPSPSTPTCPGRADNDAMVDAAVDAVRRGSTSSTTTPRCRCRAGWSTCTEEEWDLTIATNLSAIFWACRAAMPAPARGRRRQHHQHRVGARPHRLARATPRTARPRPGSSRSPARSRSSTGPTVRANVIAPGLDRHAPVPQGRRRDGRRRRVPRRACWATSRCTGSAPPRTCRGIALFLASDLSAYTSGAVIPADGGLAAYR